MKSLKKYILILGIAMAGICLTGCSASVVSLTDEENKEVARYIADKLMQYDSNYKRTELIYSEPELITEATPTPVPVPEMTQAPEQNDITGGDDSSETTDEENRDDIVEWSEIFKTDKWEINYSSYNTYSVYPKNSDLYQISAGKGKELLVLFFDVNNLTDKKIKVNLIDNGLKYELTIGDETYQPLISILESGGLMYLNTKIPAGKTIKTELIFEVPKDVNLENMRLDVTK